MSQHQRQQDKWFSFKHSCELPQSLRDDQRPSPYAPFYRKWCFEFRSFFTIYKNSQSQHYFRSNASLNKERTRHLATKRYRYVIHPFSKFAVRKRALLFVLWFTTLMLDPFLGTFLYRVYFEHGMHPAAVALYGFVQLLLILDMIGRFFTGYIIEKTREIVLVPKRIAKNYLKGYFIVDFLPIIPTAIWALFPDMPTQYEMIIYQMRMVRAFRLKVLVSNLDVTLKQINVSEPVRVCVHISVVGLLMIHWWTCVARLLPAMQYNFQIQNNLTWLVELKKHREQVDISRKTEVYTVFHDYFQYVALIMCHFFGAGYTRYRTQCPIEMTVLSMVLINGLFFYLITLAKVMELFGMVNISESKYEELVAQAGEYMRSMKFPSKLRKRMDKYYDYKYDKTFFSEEKILYSLSEHLRMEVLLYSCQNLVEKVQLFHGLSKSAVGSILALLHQEIYLPGDVIMGPEDEIGTLYFILYGTCGVQLVSGKEAMHIEDGNHFGEIKKIGGTRDVLYKIVALEASEIYSLKSSDIAFCCRSYPEIPLRLEMMSASKARYYRTVLAMAETEEEIKAMDIIDELRRGRILQQSRKREALLFT